MKSLSNKLIRWRFGKDSMKFYYAPMEGVTNFVYRNTYNKFFNNIDKYFTPFITANDSRRLNSKELEDVLPENNEGIKIVPQILANESDKFIKTADRLIKLGYSEINLNLGCPSGTVCGKGRGAGFLKDKDKLKNFLDDIYLHYNGKINISIKTRLGYYDTDEFYELLEMYNSFPLYELIIHPRTREEFYGGEPHYDIFEEALEESRVMPCYNGNIFYPYDYEKIITKYKNLDSVMIGRGLLRNPGLIEEIKTGKKFEKEDFLKFNNALIESFSKAYSEPVWVLARMKELWGYMIFSFPDKKDEIKNLRKCTSIEEFQKQLNLIF